MRLLDLRLAAYRSIDIGKRRLERLDPCCFSIKVGEVSRSGNDNDFVLLSTATSVGSSLTTISINSTIVDAVNHIWFKRHRSTH